MRHIILFFCLNLLAPLALYAGGASSTEKEPINTPYVVVGVSNFLFETTMQVDPQQYGFPLAAEGLDEATFEKEQLLADHVPHLHRLSGSIFQALLAMKNAFSEKDPTYDLQLFGVAGSHTSFVKNWLEAAGIVWKGQKKEGKTGCCFTFVHNDASHFLVYPGVSCELDLAHLEGVLCQENIQACFISGFLCKQNASFGRENLLNVVVKKELQDQTIFFLPDRSFMEKNDKSFFQSAMMRVGYVAGRVEDIGVLFAENGNLFEQLNPFANRHKTTFLLTEKGKGSYTVTPEKTYHHKPLKVPPSTKRIEPLMATAAYTGAYQAGKLKGESIDQCGKRGLQAALQTASSFKDVLY